MTLKTYNVPMIYDLHTHTSASDGSLAPCELLALAIEHGVGVLAITDHDTLEAYDVIRSAESSPLQIVQGIELSTTWAGRGIHVVGLNLDAHSKPLLAGIARQSVARIERARKISRRLARSIGIDDPFESVLAIAGASAIGRPHFARHLVAVGVVKDTRTAFRKYLGAGKPGDVRDGWAEMDEVIGWIRGAGGTAVLAHPAQYRMTNNKLRLLLEDFTAAGGGAMEVVSGSQTPAVTENLASLARDFGLAASCGSDFHHPEQTWSLPGRFAELPANLKKVWELW
ncbi:MAG TPA: PHP domain-containing protein [Woeseiaceae bacterium]|nr:PHP domain-containing protein [Woeseiaceae bacterium]